ncbi:hypothetical protein [Chlamydia pecorum]|uniref:hypothetical protein n=1 Tax=Chlamydia pecorum TaxID=85991 RepID=UPI001F275997|nr:hypothetical protein [Chlamydia pecorum]
MAITSASEMPIPVTSVTAPESPVQETSPKASSLIDSLPSSSPGLVSHLSAVAPLPIRPYGHPNTCMGRLKTTAETINRFLRDNWKYILLYILAWALIVACHHAVAITLTIWLGIGLGIGLIFWSFLVSNCLDRDNKNPNMNSLWNLINYGLQQLDPNGTRQILLATIIASISSLIYAIPQAVGFVIGFSIGNQIGITATYGLRFGDEANYVADKQAHQKKIRKIKKAIYERQLFKQQLILQKQLQLIASKVLSEEDRQNMLDPLNSLQLGINIPLPYIFDLPPEEGSRTHLLDDIDLLIERTNQQLLSLSQQYLHLQQEPERIIEE